MQIKTVGRVIRLVNLLLLGVLALAPSCGGSAKLTSRPAANPVAPAAATKHNVFSVRMNPQTPITPGFKQVSQLSSPSALRQLLPAPAALARATAASDGTVSRDASSYSGTMPSNRTSKIGSFSEFTPNCLSASPPAADLAFCAYDITLAQAPTTATASLLWDAANAPATSDTYLGFSNWQTNSWVWYAMDADGTVTLPGYSNYMDPSGRILLALVVTGSKRGLLQLVTLGQAEQRGTGSDPHTLDSGDEYPPLYAPPLPASYDLTPGCAAVNDQGTWGSCTAFAFGDGADNYELNAIYGSLGWNLSNSFNRVSPKFLYISSGDLGGYPPDPDQGRYMDDVGAALVSHGVSSDEHAPYDLIYDDNWSSDALADAALLHASSYYSIPCGGEGGLQTVKAVLAESQTPVVMSINLDDAFMYYAPGQVWNYYGPAVGGHAMCIVGYDDAKNAFKVRNSWSSSWGEDGYVWIGYGTFSNADAAVNCYVVTNTYDSQVALHFTGNSDPLSPPTGLAASDGTLDTGVGLTWTQVPGATGYNIYRDKLGNKVATVGAVDNWLDTTVSSDYSYVYWVTAVQGADESYYSASDLGYIAQKPVVTGVTPHGGSAGGNVTFQATSYGGGSPTYSWNFGAAATPGTSSEAAPQVVLGAEGAYDCTLTVTNSKGSDAYDFSISIGKNLPPVVYVHVSPSSGKAPVAAQFDASTSFDPDGSIVLYQWSWNGDNVWEEQSTTPYASHTFDTEGDHQVHVQATDNSGQTTVRIADVQVYPANAPPYGSLNPDTYGGPNPLSVTFTPIMYDDDGTIVEWDYDFDNDGVVDEVHTDATPVTHIYSTDGTYRCALTCIDNGGAQGMVTAGPINVGFSPLPDGWSAYPLSNVTYDYNDGYRIWSVGGMPILMQVKHTDNTVLLYRATNDDPQGVADWASVETPVPGVAMNTPVIGDLNGTPYLVYQTRSSLALNYATLSGGNWVSHVVDTGGAQHEAGQSPRVCTIDGKPCIVYLVRVTPTTMGLYYARALTATPASASDWKTMQLTVPANTSQAYGMIEIGSRPELVYGRRNGATLDLGYAYATKVDPDTGSDWAEYDTNVSWDMNGGASIMAINGTPAVFYGIMGNGQTRLLRTTQQFPAVASDWDYYVVDIDGSAGMPNCFTVAGRPAITYQINNPRISIANVADPQSLLDWTKTSLYPTWKAALVGGFSIAGGNRAAAIMNDDDEKTAYYAYQRP